jgi:hypothetical protein
MGKLGTGFFLAPVTQLTENHSDQYGLFYRKAIAPVLLETDFFLIPNGATFQIGRSQSYELAVFSHMWETMPSVKSGHSVTIREKFICYVVALRSGQRNRRWTGQLKSGNSGDVRVSVGNSVWTSFSKAGCRRYTSTWCDSSPKQDR